MSDHSASLRPDAASSPAWRNVLLWAFLALTLTGGLYLALRHGAEAPRLLDFVEVLP